MRRNLYLLLAAMLACTVLAAAGCGGDDDNGGSSNNENTQQVIDNCKQSVDGAQGLSSGTKNDLKDRCEKAGDDADEARKAAQDVCVKIVEDTIPSGPARDQAVDACKQTSQ